MERTGIVTACPEQKKRLDQALFIIGRLKTEIIIFGHVIADDDGEKNSSSAISSELFF